VEHTRAYEIQDTLTSSERHVFSPAFKNGSNTQLNFCQKSAFLEHTALL